MPHPSLFRTAVISSGLLAAGMAFAQPAYVDIEQRLTPGELRATGLDMLASAQLAELNRILRTEAESASAARAQRRDADTPPEGSSLLGFNDKPIRANLVGSVSGWGPGTVFELDNGQKWKVLKGSMKLRKPLVAPAIMVVPGIAGRWFLQVDEDLAKARVYRID